MTPVLRCEAAVDPQDEPPPDPDDAPDADYLGGHFMLDDSDRARRLTWASAFRRVWREDVLIHPSDLHIRSDTDKESGHTGLLPTG